jgi:hypothetical protein
MAHPKRETHALEVALAFPGSVIVWEEGRGMADTGGRALAAGLTMGATHHLVVQDDVIVSDGCAALLERLCRDLCVCLYFGQCPPTRRWCATAAERETAWVWHDQLVWGPAVLQPVDRLEAVLDHYGRLSTRSYDGRLTSYWRGHGGCLYTVPSLVDHAGLPSLVGHRNGRHAACYGSGVGVNWESEPVTVGRDRQRQPR